MGHYVAYEAHPSDAESLGQPLKAYPTRQQAVEACSDAACIGIKYLHMDLGPNPWRTFRGALWEGVTGKVRVTGENIDPWVPGPTPSS